MEEETQAVQEPVEEKSQPLVPEDAGKGALIARRDQLISQYSEQRNIIRETTERLQAAQSNLLRLEGAVSILNDLCQDAPNG